MKMPRTGERGEGKPSGAEPRLAGRHERSLMADGG